MKRIPVVFATDENYIFYTCIAITSMAVNAREDTYYEIYVLVNAGFRRDGCLLNKLPERYRNLKIVYVEVDAGIFDNVVINNSHVTKVTFYRLLLSSLIQEERCIYLDGDILVTDDLQQLFETELDDVYVAGCRDVWIDLLPDKEREERRIRTGLPDMSQYVNAGVLLMNLQKIREDGIDKVFLQNLNMDYLFEDQDVLNVCCYDKIKHLPARWNMFTLFFGQQDKLEEAGVPSETIAAFRQRKGIIHYATPFIRPWEQYVCWANWMWWEMAEKWKEESTYLKLQEKVRYTERQRSWKCCVEAGKRAERIVIFGYTGWGRQMCAWMIRAGFKNKLLFCDNAQEKQLQKYEDIEVLPFKAVTEDERDSIYLIASQKRGPEVRKILLDSDIKEDRIFCYQPKSVEYFRYLDRRFYGNEFEDIILQKYGFLADTGV